MKADGVFPTIGSKYDQLTGLYNRESFYREAALLLGARYDVDYCIVCMDISCFKIINDLFHMDTGNLILKTAAEYIKTLLDDFHPFEVKEMIIKGDYLYAFAMKARGRKNTVLKSLGDVKARSVELLGRGPVGFTQYDGVLVCDVKGDLPSEYVNVLKIRIK